MKRHGKWRLLTAGRRRRLPTVLRKERAEHELGSTITRSPSHIVICIRTAHKYIKVDD